MFHHREFSHFAEALDFMAFALCTLFCLATCGPCYMDGMKNPVEYDECGSYRDNINSGSQDTFGGDFSQQIVSGNSMTTSSLENVCTRSNLFCFPSTLPDLFLKVHNSASTISGVQPDAKLPVGSIQASENISWSSSCGNINLSSGKVVSCSLDFQEGAHDMSYCSIDGSDQNGVSSCRGPLHNWKTLSLNENEEPVRVKSGNSDGSSSRHVEISPPLLDWGQKYLYFPSVAFVTVENTHRHNILNVYEPYTTNTQFYPCNFSEMMLGPGEVASICVVFLPTGLGLSSAHLILQTSSGGFLIQSRGFAIESPYRIQPLIGLEYSSSGRWSKNLSLYNPFDETLYVEEVTAWISFSSGNSTYSTRAVCSVKDPEGSADPSFLGVNECFGVKSGQVGLPVIVVRPHRTWEVGPNSRETIIELDFLYKSQGKILGSFCMQLLRPSKDEVDTVIVPLEAEFGGRSAHDDLKSPLSVFLEVIVPCDANGTVIVALLLENAAPYLLTVVKISGTGESTKLFQIKYVEDLILFPGTVTQVAVVTHTPLAIESHDSPSQIPHVNPHCKLLIQTNESNTPLINIPCSDVVNICSRRQPVSFVGYGYHYKEVDVGNAESRSMDSSMQSKSEIKAMEMAEADELVLENWRSQGTVSGMSVLDDHEVLFPLVHVGTYHSKWINVKNPSHQPVLMQLILNSGEIIDECRESDGILQPSSSSSLVHNDYNTPIRYGFSISEGALTKAYVHPHGSASLGPVLFHPSGRCGWKSSALVRNNISGVEWLSLRGYGGSLSLLLFEGLEPVQTIEFEYSVPSSLNFSPPEVLPNVKDTADACNQPFLKDLYAKNAGDLPVEVSKIEVSGSECGLDGFVVHSCKGFSLEPGESTKLTVSFRADFSAAMVQRDLELTMAAGILVIPMKSSLPTSMLKICKRSILWLRVKKSSVAILLAGFIVFLVFCCIIPQLTSFGSIDYLFNGRKSSIATMRHAENSFRLHRNQKHGSRFSLSTDLNGFLRSIRKGETKMQESVGRYPDRSVVALQQGRAAQNGNETVGHQVHSNCLPDSKKEMGRLSSLQSKSVSVESPAAQESSQPGNLTVKIGKEKGRRRRKKKSSGAGLTGQFEVSSSQSGNSTPSSPLSPLSSLTPKRSLALSPDVDQCVRSPFTQVADRVCEKTSGNVPASGNKLEPKASLKYGSNSLFFPTKEQPPAPRNNLNKPVLLPSATFPSTGRSTPSLMCPSSVLASTSTIAPQARAPGFKLHEGKAVKTEEKEHKDEFKYDIWGDHLFGLRVTGASKEVSVMSPLVKESNSDSFFARGPQSVVPISQADFVSPDQNYE